MILQRRTAVALLLAALALTSHAATGAAPASSPTARVQAAVTEVVGVLRDETLDREMRWERIGMVINRSFDFEAMSQSVLATNWRKASPAERERFVDFFSQYLEDTYRTKIEGYTDQEIRYTGETVRDDRATVDTIIVSGSTEIPVTYRLRLEGGEWYAYDVVIEGASLVNTYRETFSAIVRAEGMDGVLADLQERIARYKAAHPDAVAPPTPAP